MSSRQNQEKLPRVETEVWIRVWGWTEPRGHWMQVLWNRLVCLQRLYASVHL